MTAKNHPTAMQGLVCMAMVHSIAESTWTQSNELLNMHLVLVIQLCEGCRSKFFNLNEHVCVIKCSITYFAIENI
jgi:hypothetical protein